MKLFALFLQYFYLLLINLFPVWCLFVFFLLYAFCCFFLTVIGTFESLSFVNLSRKLFSVFDIMIFDMSWLVLKSRELQFFSNLIISSQWSSGASVFACFALRKISSVFFRFFCVSDLCYKAWIVFRFYFCPIGIGFWILLSSVLVQARMQQPVHAVSFPIFYSKLFRLLFLLWSTVELPCYLAFFVFFESLHPLSVIAIFFIQLFFNFNSLLIKARYLYFIFGHILSSFLKVASNNRLFGLKLMVGIFRLVHIVVYYRKWKQISV